MPRKPFFVYMLSVVLGISALTLPAISIAQPIGDDIESLFAGDQVEAPATPRSESGSETPKAQDQQKSKQTQEPKVEVKGLSDLDKLAPFKDVAVIQKRYLPKTGRFELFGGASYILNDAFFLNVGLNGRAAYYFRERYGIEFVSFFLAVMDRQVTTDLRERRGVITTSLITPKSYLGMDFKWTPIYGKMTWLNKRITPFDLYFSLGAGTTGTSAGTNEPTIHLGTGQSFALSKSMAFRWDFSWNFFNAQYKSGGASESGNFNNLYLTAGLSFFFPEANYR